MPLAAHSQRPFPPSQLRLRNAAVPVCARRSVAARHSCARGCSRVSQHHVNEQEWRSRAHPSCAAPSNYTPDSMAATESSSIRSWWAVVGGVALTSSAITTIGILGVQRVYRKQRRHELEEDIRRATRAEASKGDAGHAEKQAHREQYAYGEVDTATPKYLATLAASQSGSLSRSSSPRPGATSVTTPAVRPSAANFHGLTRQPSFQMRPSLSSSSSSRKLGAATTTPPRSYDESLIREQLSRNYSFLGEEAMSKVRGAFVIVVGAGGVGSWCALMLLRSGVGKLRLIDFDQVSLSSLNRHACANLADVGRPKVVVCREHFANIAPWADVDAQVEIFRGSEADRLLGPSVGDEPMAPTYVVDAIDNLDTKVDLLEYCYRHKIKCFSSMGAGAKADPGQVQVADLNVTAEDPLARRVRRRLRAKGVWGSGAMWNRRERKKGPGSADDSKRATKEALESEVSKRQDDREATLEKLESRGPSTARKLESSGRGADESAVSEDRRTSGADKRTSGADRRTSGPEATSNGGPEAGYSRYSRSRRTSSASSMGSAQFFSPASVSPDDGSGPEALDAAEERDNTIRGFHLPDAVVDEGGEEVVEGEKQDGTPSRPPLSTLTSEGSRTSSSGGPSRRTSSLKELVAEDMRSSQSGKQARSFVSGIPSSMQEVQEEASEDEGGGEREKPFTIMCVYSNEKSDTRLLPLDEEEFQKGNVEELAALEDFRVRILPVLGPLPAMFGLAAATYILCDLAGRELETVPWKNRRKTYERVSTTDVAQRGCIPAHCVA